MALQPGRALLERVRRSARCSFADSSKVAYRRSVKDCPLCSGKSHRMITGRVSCAALVGANTQCGSSQQEPRRNQSRACPLAASADEAEEAGAAPFMGDLIAMAKAAGGPLLVAQLGG